jgi:hypothetical protein
MSLSVRRSWPSVPDARQTLAQLLCDTIVTVDTRPFTARDIVAAGALSGRWHELERELARGLATVRQQRPTPDAVSRALRDFRYEHRLISAAEFVAWATHWRLESDDVREVLERRIVREELGNLAGADAPACDRDEMVATLAAEAICSGALRDCAQWLVDRMLVAGDVDGEASGLDATLVEHEHGLVAAAILDEPDETRWRRLARLAAAAGAYERHVAATCADDAVARRIGRHLVDWMRFELVGLECRSAGAAAETVMLLTEDGLSVARVTELTGVGPLYRQLRLDEAPEQLRASLAGASTGDVLGPVAMDGAQWVWVVTARQAPDASDPQLVQRARELVLSESMERLRAGRVTWHGRH